MFHSLELCSIGYYGEICNNVYIVHYCVLKWISVHFVKIYTVSTQSKKNKEDRL